MIVYKTNNTGNKTNVDILVAWIPEYLVEAQDLETFLQLDGTLASEQGSVFFF